MPNTFENLRFYHAAKNAASASVLPPSLSSFSNSTVAQLAVWETCLRKIYFFNSPLETHETTDNLQVDGETKSGFFEGSSALEFLLSLLCGLDSKVVGETEIFGQFKLFAQSAEAQRIAFFRDPRAVQFLFQEVKVLRDTHLKGLGVQSYGSLIRRMSKDLPRVSILGYGHLAQEIIPWFKNKHIDIHVRNPKRYSDSETFSFHELNQTPFAELVVIAAPIATAELTKMFAAKGQKTKQIIDCRSLDAKQTSLLNSLCTNDFSDNFTDNYHVVELKDLFQLLSGEQQRIHEALPLIRQEISRKVEAYSLKSHHRPMGWDDLC